MTKRKKLIAMLVAVFMVLAMMPLSAQESYAETKTINMFGGEIYMGSTVNYKFNSDITYAIYHCDDDSYGDEGIPFAGHEFSWKVPYNMHDFFDTTGCFIVETKDGKTYQSEPIRVKMNIKGDDYSEAFPDKTYTGKKITHGNFEIDYGPFQLYKSDFSSVTYSNNLKVGTATITLKGKGRIGGTNTVKFKILPKGTTIKTPKKGKKSFTAKWKKQKTKMSKSRITGYQVQYSTKSDFSSNVGNKYVKGYKKTSKKIKGLQKKTVYYVRVRTYMKVGGKYYYSTWSKTKAVKTK